MRCPKDDSELTRRSYESVAEVDRCPTCNGVWLDAGELERIQETVKIDYSAELAKIPSDVIDAYRRARAMNEPSRNCPRCRREMERREYGFCSQILIDVCPGCRGIWLDDQELAALEIFFERSQLPTTSMRSGFWGSTLGLMTP